MEIDTYFRDTTAPIIEESLRYIILLNKTIIVSLCKKYPADIFRTNLLCDIDLQTCEHFVRRIGCVDAEQKPCGSVAKKGRGSLSGMEIGTRCLYYFSLSFARWTRAHPLKVSQMISNITVKLSRRRGSSIRVRSPSRALFFL